MMESKEKGKRDENGDELVLVEAATDGGDDDEDATAQEKMKQNGGHQHSRGQSSDPAGDLKVNHHNSSSSQMLGLLDEFTKIYSDRLQRVEQTAMKTTDKQYLESKVCVLESWVRDLGEQNAVLVATVEELEKEAADRVALLEDRLAKMAVTTRESCVSLRDHQMQVSSLVADKIGLEKETHGLFDKLVRLEKGNLRLKEENNNLTSDLNNLVQIISRARVTGQWEADDLTFSCVTPEQVFGPVLSSSRRSSQSLKDSQRDYIHQMLEDHIKKDNSSIRSSLSNLQDADSGSIYGSRGSEKDMIIMKLKSELRCSQTAHEEVNCQVVERDKQIADLQAQLTEIHHELAESQAEVSRVTHALTELRHQNRHESIEVSSRKEEVIRHLLCKASSKRDNIKGSFPSLCDLDTAGTSDNNIEAQLSENIDILAGRLAELEDECQQMRDQHSVLQDTHSLCAPTINMLQDQLSRSQQTQVELRTVLTAEVAERHDQIVTLKDQVKEHEQTHHETQMQLQLRNEVIKELRREVREQRERASSIGGAKSMLTPVEEEVVSSCKQETKSTETQTYQIDSLDKGAMTEQCSIASPPNGFYPNSPQFSQVSKLHNELAEKSVLLRELQSHLAASRQEINLKDETLYKLEQKLNTSRREDGQKGERMQYLTGQLTSLQLEVGRTHGQAEHLRRQAENKNEVLQKIESENASLTKMLNEKSATLEKYQNDVLRMSSDLDKRRREVTDQRLTISSLQDALVASKRTCDDLRMRLESDITSKESETDRLERELKCAQNLQHQTFTQLVESDARGEVFREENRALSRRVSTLHDDVKQSLSLDSRQVERANRDRDNLRRHLHEAERRCQEMVTSVQLLQGQVQTLEEEVTAASEARSEAERRATEAHKKNVKLQESLSVPETSESVGRLGRQLEDTVAAMTKAREEAHSKAEQLRQAKQDVTQLSDALSYEKELNTNLHDQMENLMKVAGSHEHKTAEQQQELRKIIRDAMQKDRQISTLEAQVEGLKSQILALEDLVAEEQKEVASLNESLAWKEVSRGEEQVVTLRKDLQQAEDQISRQDQRIKEMVSERDSEVAAVAERLTAAHEASVRRLEGSLLSYSRLQAHDEFQVENLEESLRDLGVRLAESELRGKELEREREALNRSLRQEQMRREDEAQEYQRQLMRITEEMTLMKARLEGVQEETVTWQRQCEDLEERHQHTEGGTTIQTQLLKAQHQVDNMRESVLAAKLETRKAEEERSHAHEQVLSLIRECNNLEEQIHRLTKDKCRLQDRLSCKESDMMLLEQDNISASSKDELMRSADRIAHLERELTRAKRERSFSDIKCSDDQLRSLRHQLKEAQSEIQRIKESSKDKETGADNAMYETSMTSHEVTTLTRRLRETEHRETILKDQLYAQNLSSCGGGNSGEIMMSQLRSEIAAARRESSEARRMLLEKESQSRMAQLKIDTLQKMLHDRQLEVSGLEEKLTESQTETHRSETEVAQLRARVATLTTQLSHAQSHSRASSSSHSLTNPEKVESLEDEVSRVKGELAAKIEELNQVCERDNRSVAKVRDLDQEITRITKSRDEAYRKVVSLEGSLAESLESSEATKSLEKMWETQLANIQQEVSRLLCETSQLKECNIALHEQLSASQSETAHLRSESRSKDSQMEELQHARDLLANDAQVVVAAVKQWLHEQKTTNSKLAGKLHQQNKHILHLNTEKQFLAERNTSLQRINHEMSMQVHDFRARLGLPLIMSSSNEKMNKTGGFLSPQLLSPQLLSPLGGGGSSRVVSTTPPLDTGFGPSSDSVFCHSVFGDKFEDGFSTCSSEGSSGGGCHVPGPDLPGTLQLERLAHLADSLLLASRNITRSSNAMQGHKSNKMTSNSLSDLTSSSNFSHSLRSPLGYSSRKTSSSVGNLSLLSPIESRDKPTSPKFSYRFSDTASVFSLGSKAGFKGGDFILAPPVRERKTSQRLFHTHSIDEAEEEEIGTSVLTETVSRHQGLIQEETPRQSLQRASSASQQALSLSSEIDSEVNVASQTPRNTQTLEISKASAFGESSA